MLKQFNNKKGSNDQKIKDEIRIAKKFYEEMLADNAKYTKMKDLYVKDYGDKRTIKDTYKNINGNQVANGRIVSRGQEVAMMLLTPPTVAGMFSDANTKLRDYDKDYNRVKT